MCFCRQDTVFGSDSIQSGFPWEQGKSTYRSQTAGSEAPSGCPGHRQICCVLSAERGRRYAPGWDPCCCILLEKEIETWQK